jgi:hypothetical protein
MIVIASQTTPFDLFKDEALKNHRKLNKQYKENKLREHFLNKGALYPGTFNNKDGKPAFDKNDRISLLLYSQNPDLENKFLSKDMKKIMTGKQIKDRDGVQPAQYFNNRSVKEIYAESLSPETNRLGSIMVSNKYKSPVKKFLNDLDDMVYNQQHSYESLNDDHLQPNLDIINSERSRKFAANRGKYSSVPKNKIRISPTDTDQITFLRVKPFHVNISRETDLSYLEKEIYTELIKIKKDQLQKISLQMFKGQDPLVNHMF